MAPRKAKDKAEEGKAVEPVVTDIIEIQRGIVECWVVGETPLLFNRMSEKAKRELLYPKGKKTAAERQISMKHNPPQEYRDSVNRLSTGPTLIGLPSTAFKGAMMTAALDLPGAKKAQIGRLCFVLGDYVSVYGVPQLHMCPVRSADMNRTPDIRTRAIMARWAAKVAISFTQPLMRSQAVVNLLAAGGQTAGVGDWRPEKGSGSKGLFRLVGPDDPELKEIMAEGGRAVQEKALETPTCFDDESTELLTWFEAEVQRRSMKGVA